MKKTTAPAKKAPSPAKRPETKTEGGGKAKSPSAMFIAAALDMSWRLAVVVLLPLIGGVEIDKHLGTSPWFTLLGFLLAMAGTGFVMWQTLQQVNRSYDHSDDNKESNS